jgi:hypothetical protein
MTDQQLHRNPFPNVTFGDHHTNIGKIDWDERCLHEVKRYSFMLNNRYDLDGFIILQSSTKKHRIKNEELTKVVYEYKTKSYHTVFNREVSKDELDSYLAWLCLTIKDLKLIEWYLLQNTKQTYTLRCGFKGRKKPPRIVFKYGNQDKMIAEFLDNRQFILDFLNGENRNDQDLL